MPVHYINCFLCSTVFQFAIVPLSHVYLCCLYFWCLKTLLLRSISWSIFLMSFLLLVLPKKQVYENVAPIIKKMQIKLQWDIMSHLLENSHYQDKEGDKYWQGCGEIRAIILFRKAKWCSHYGKQYGSSTGSWKLNYHMIQQLHFWIFSNTS